MDDEQKGSLSLSYIECAEAKSQISYDKDHVKPEAHCSNPNQISITFA
jgi:hypothetical protein